VTHKTELVFSEIEGALIDGRFDAGVIIHENRFTYGLKGLQKIVDLGELWEQTTGAPIPLGAIAINRALPDEVQRTVNLLVRESVEYALAHPAASTAFVRAHAQEMDEAVMRQHIALYVNDYSVDLGAEGRGAIETLFDRAHRSGVIGQLPMQLFVPSAP
jgi:1,4-dihydroxy-6-naphthoate synthase